WIRNAASCWSPTTGASSISTRCPWRCMAGLRHGCATYIFPSARRSVYSHPLGLVVDALAGMGVMYPPFFREREKSDANRAGLAFLRERLHEEPGSVVGIHPEGGRS